MRFFKQIINYRLVLSKYIIQKKLIRGICRDIKRHWLSIWRNLDMLIAQLGWRALARKHPLKNNQIMFRTYQDEYTCNPKYLCEEIIRQGLDYDLVWVCSKKTVHRFNFPPQVRTVEFDSVEYYEELVQSKFLIDNAHNFTWEPVYKRKGQILINLWHGSLGLKRINADTDTNTKRVKAGKRGGKYTDYCISNSEFEDMVYRTTYWPNTAIKRFGHPRNDLMFSDAASIAEIKLRVCRELEINPDCKLLLYAPTFRDGKDFRCFNIDYLALRNALTTRFGGNWIILTRFHYHTKKLIKKMSADMGLAQHKFVVSADNYDDIQELIAVSDAAITDYSSWICDFVLTHRPGFLFTTDIDTYVTERGFYYPLEDTPFPIACNNDELVNNVLNFNEDKYEQNINKYFERLACCEDGNASKRVIDLINEEASK